MLEVKSKLEQCQAQLQRWDRSKYGNIGKVHGKKKDKNISKVANGRDGSDKTVTVRDRPTFGALRYQMEATGETTLVPKRG